MTDGIQKIRDVLEKATMQLCAYGANNTVWLREAIDELNRIEGNVLPDFGGMSSGNFKSKNKTIESYRIQSGINARAHRSLEIWQGRNAKSRCPCRP